MKGCSRFTYRVPSVIFLFLLLFTSAIGLSGCSEKNTNTNHAGAKHSLDRIKETPHLSFLGAAIIPIQITEGEFYKAAGWLNEDTILYISIKGDSSSLYSYQLGTGKENLLYKSEMPITTAELNPDKELILIHSSASSNEGTLTIIDTAGKEDRKSVV